MNRKKQVDPTDPPEISVAPGCLREHQWKRFLRGPDQMLLDDLYVPMLSEAIKYDRCCSYFSSTSLAAAARGYSGLIKRLIAAGAKASRPAIRLVVNEELSSQDVKAMTETGDLSKLEMQLSKRLKNPKDILAKQRLIMLAWLVKQGYLEVRVGVMRHGGGIVHAKYGIATDDTNDALVFAGSGNETASGLYGNYEEIEVSTSWDDSDRYNYYTGQFDLLWRDEHPDVHTVSLPEALRLKLIKLAPEEAPVIEPSNAIARQKAAMIWQFIAEAPYMLDGGATCDATAMVDLWPHQINVVEETAKAWPNGRLLCDEVGMGKTIEAILVLRRLLAGRGVKRALILLPAGLLKQWQAELREKGGLVIPRLEGLNRLYWPGDKSQTTSGLEEVLKQNLLIMSRETARMENNLRYLLDAEPWDIVILDESHAARRRSQVEGEFNSGTLLLDLLRNLQLQKRTKAFLLLSATPMQTHPWEPWDLLGVLGEGGAWLADFSGIRTFYETIEAVSAGRCNPDMARKVAELISYDTDFPDPPIPGAKKTDSNALSKMLMQAAPNKRDEIANWLRSGSPLTRRMHRNTKNTLRHYYKLGLLPEEPPLRDIVDVRYDFSNRAERDVYDSIKRYIDRRFEELEKEKTGKGFVMTVYRRRSSSSPQALQKSLERRRDGLNRVVHSMAIESTIDYEDGLDSRDIDDLGEIDQETKLSSALPADPRIARNELNEVDKLLENLRALGNRDSKLDEFYGKLRGIVGDGRPLLIFSEYVDTMNYLRDNLYPHYGNIIGTFSGEGGRIRNGDEWALVSKDEITQKLFAGKLKILICTDAASEGLNLQAASAIINYDLPWNPSKVEQRIGRIDRIGQKISPVKVVNLFLKNSVDDQVYRILRYRCGVFEQFVGTMQPVLASARRMLLGKDEVDSRTLEFLATEAEQNRMADATYFDSLAEESSTANARLGISNMIQALSYLDESSGVNVTLEASKSVYKVKAQGIPLIRFSAKNDALERDRSLIPLSPLSPQVERIAGALSRPGENLPFVVGSSRDGSFKTTAAYWIDKKGATAIGSFNDLVLLIEQWNGECPEPSLRIAVENKARVETERIIRRANQSANKTVNEALSKQVAAARLRLLRELGRYLLCMGSEISNLNDFMHTQMKRDIASAPRLKRCREKLDGYPNWTSSLLQEISDNYMRMTENERAARRLGSELEAALLDPRWQAKH